MLKSCRFFCGALPSHTWQSIDPVVTKRRSKLPQSMTVTFDMCPRKCRVILPALRSNSFTAPPALPLTWKKLCFPVRGSAGKRGRGNLIPFRAESTFLKESTVLGVGMVNLIPFRAESSFLKESTVLGVGMVSPKWRFRVDWKCGELWLCRVFGVRGFVYVPARARSLPHYPLVWTPLCEAADKLNIH